MDLYTFCLIDHPDHVETEQRIYSARTYLSYEQAEQKAKAVAALMGGVSYQVEPVNYYLDAAIKSWDKGE